MSLWRPSGWDWVRNVAPVSRMWTSKESLETSIPTKELTVSIMKKSPPCECELGAVRRRFCRLFGLISRGRQRPCFCSVLEDLIAIGLLPAAPAVAAALRDLWESLRFAAPAGAGSI